MAGRFALHSRPANNEYTGKRNSSRIPQHVHSTVFKMWFVTAAGPREFCVASRTGKWRPS